MPVHEPFVSLSLGGGVQSTTMLLALLAGDLPGPRPQLVVFADTGWEPRRVYEHVTVLSAFCEEAEVPFEWVVLNPQRSLRDDLVDPRGTGTRNPNPGVVDIPAFYRHPDGGNVSIGKRQCTSNYKIVPIERAVRRAMGVHAITRYRPAISMIGISRDEAERMAPNKNPNIENTYPLIDAGWSRGDCLRWLQKNHPDLKPGKSACVGCPFHSDLYWKQMPADERADAIEVDEAIRHTDGKMPQYLHRSGRPLPIVFEDLDRQPELPLDMPADECGGYCFI